MFNILSIDWDYFINASANERLLYFPDVPNEKYNKSVQNSIWVSRYSQSDKLIDFEYCKEVHELVKNIMYIKNVMIAESHADIYSFIKNLMGKHTHVNLVNIDFHSDFRKDIDEIDCGNWLSVLMDEYSGNYEWLGRDDSFKEGIPKKLHHRIRLKSVMKTIRCTVWNAVFVCRSDMWSPPHLDDAFTKSFYPLTEGRYKNVFIQDGIWNSRYSDEMKKNVEDLKKIYFDISNK